MPKYFYLSFANDAEDPYAIGFLGACQVQADTFKDAITEAYRLGINPGGSVVGVEITEEELRDAGMPLNTLLQRKDIPDAVRVDAEIMQSPDLCYAEQAPLPRTPPPTPSTKRIKRADPFFRLAKNRWERKLLKELAVLERMTKYEHMRLNWAQSTRWYALRRFVEMLEQRRACWRYERSQCYTSGGVLVMVPSHQSDADKAILRRIKQTQPKGRQ